MPTILFIGIILNYWVKMLLGVNWAFCEIPGLSASLTSSGANNSVSKHSGQKPSQPVRPLVGHHFLNQYAKSRKTRRSFCVVDCFSNSFQAKYYTA